MVDSLVGWLHAQLTWGNGALALGLFAATLIGSVLAAAFLLVRIHPLYFQGPSPPRASQTGRSQFKSWTPMNRVKPLSLLALRLTGLK